MKNIFKKIHLWLSIPVGIIFFVTCLSGAILVFEEEITDAYYSDIRHVEVPNGGKALSEEQIFWDILSHMGEETEIREIQQSDAPDQAWKVTLFEPRGAAVYVNQYTGEITGDCSRLKFFSDVMSLHRWLFDSPKEESSLGRQVVGWCTVAAFFIVLSGFIVWFPASLKSLKSHLKIKLRPRKALWYTLHSAGGFYVGIVLLLMILTGLTWSFPDYGEWAVEQFGDLPIYSLHTGSWLGIAGKILWFIAALVGASLPITGYYIWLKKPHKSR